MAISLERRGRNWAVYENETLVCLTVYKKGAKEVVRRLASTGARNPQRTKERRKQYVQRKLCSQ